MMSWQTGVYRITNATNGKVYIGGAYKSLSARIASHKTALNLNKHANRHLQAAWNKYGPKVFKFSVLRTCPAEAVVGLEQKLIDLYDSTNRRKGYNICPKAGTTLGMVHPPRKPETLARMSAARKGKAKSESHKAAIAFALKDRKFSVQHRARLSAYRRGRKLSLEHRAAIARGSRAAQSSFEYRAKMADIIRGKKRTPEQRKRMSDRQIGRKMSPETCEKISAALKGRRPWSGKNHTEATRAKMKIAAKERWRKRRENTC